MRYIGHAHGRPSILEGLSDERRRSYLKQCRTYREGLGWYLAGLPRSIPEPASSVRAVVGVSAERMSA